jgi:hypothetical protein
MVAVQVRDDGHLDARDSSCGVQGVMVGLRDRDGIEACFGARYGSSEQMPGDDAALHCGLGAVDILPLVLIYQSRYRDFDRSTMRGLGR